MHASILRLGLSSLIAHARGHRAGRHSTRFARRRFAALLGCLLLATARPASAADTPLVFGVFPSLTARQIATAYRPLADALEKPLRRRVFIYSARDFRSFVGRTRQGEYDIVLTAPHLAWLARQDGGYQPLLKYTQPTRGLLVVRADSPFDRADALFGRTIATADRSAVTVLAMQAELAAHHLRQHVDYRTIDSGTHLNAVMQVVNGRADAAMLGLHPYRLTPPDLRQQLRVIAETPPLSGLVFLTHPRLGKAEAQAARQALLDFAATPAGQAFLQQGGYGGFSAVGGDELRALRRYALQAEELLRASR